jgi:hypothetical protein
MRVVPAHAEVDMLTCTENLNDLPLLAGFPGSPLTSTASPMRAAAVVMVSLTVRLLSLQSPTGVDGDPTDGQGW